MLAEPSRRRAWQGLTLVLLFVGYSGYYLCRSNLSVAAVPIQAELADGDPTPGLGRARFGDLVSAGTLAYALGKFLGGGLGDRIGGRAVFLTGMAGAALFTACFPLVWSVPARTLAWSGNRLVQAIGWPGVVKLVGRWFPYQRHGLAMGLVSLSFLFGDAAARWFLGRLLAAGWDWKPMFLACAGLLAAFWALAALVLRDGPESVGLPASAANPENVYGESEDGGPEAGARLGLIGPLLRSPRFGLVCGLSAGLTLLRETFNTWTPTYLTQGAGLSAAAAANASALFPLLGGVSVLACGLLGDRLGRGGRALILAVGLALAGVMLGLLAGLDPSRSPRWSVALIALVGLFLIGPYTFLAGAFALDFGGRRGAATASGWIDGFGYLGGVLAGSGVARLATAFGWRGVFATLAAVAWTAAGVAGILVRVQRAGGASARPAPGPDGASPP